MAFNAGVSSAHIGGALSIVEITATLFGAIMNYDPKNPLSPGRDRFILSKGHACLTYYAILHEVGYISKKELLTFEQSGSSLLGHPVMNPHKGIEFSTGSLGMGLSLGIGVAIAAKRRNQHHKVYVIIGDGECNEGSIWEASMAASHFKLDNLTVVVDRNNFQQTGLGVDIMSTENLCAKWRSFGWDTEEVDGHNCSSLFEAFSVTSESLKPKAFIANTVKGKGISFAENNNSWHHAVLTKANYESALKELEMHDYEKK
jgi:transketolase